ncbi:MAG TPA: hypothetical protein VNA22_03360, partial [Pyrinomonadaceae bacterium]|nr:hypothetical protein [Pyrinomonadaceae bacterium]
MKRSLNSRFLTIAIVLTAAAMFTQAQAPVSQCDYDEFTSLYQKFRESRKGYPLAKQKVANDIAKEFISKFGACPGDAEQTIVGYIKKFQNDHAVAVDDATCVDAVNQTPARAFDLCKPHIAREPDSLRTQLLLSLAGIKTANKADKTTKDQAVRAMRRSLELIKAGQTMKNWVFGGSQTETVGALEFYTAFLTSDTAPAEAAATMLRLAHSDSSYNKDPNTYYLLARSLHNGEVNKEIADYTAKCGTKASIECSDLLKKIEGKIDRVIDAYARAV